MNKTRLYGSHYLFIIMPECFEQTHGACTDGFFLQWHQYDQIYVGDALNVLHLVLSEEKKRNSLHLERSLSRTSRF
jgi:hypothetical protein